jgi:tetratricopeptide (TPR) repeat protein
MWTAMRTKRAAALVLLVAACQRDPRDPREAPAKAPPAPAPATAKAPTAPTAPVLAERGPLTWIHDDYPAAEAKARAAGLPIFVDDWAAWCHTCISMQETVLRDPALAPFADRFVWLALDTEKTSNAAIVARYPPEAWPTFFVLSPDGTLQSRHVGAASIVQLREMLLAGERGHLETKVAGNEVAAGDPMLDVRLGDRAAAAGDNAAAAAAFARALAAAPADWPRAPEVMTRMAVALNRAGDQAACGALWKQRDRLKPGATASAADFAAIVSECLEAAPPAERRAGRVALLEMVDDVLAAPHAALSADDRSDALRIQREMARSTGDEAAARRYAEAQREVLDAAVAAAPSAWMASTYNLGLLELYVYLGRGAEIVPLIEKNVAALPTEYDPPYRLASLLLELGRFDEGIAAAKKSLELVDGPRRGIVLRKLAALYHGKGDHVAELEAKEDALAALLALPPSRSRTTGERAAREALATHAAEHAAPAAPTK